MTERSDVPRTEAGRGVVLALITGGATPEAADRVVLEIEAQASRDAEPSLDALTPERLAEALHEAWNAREGFGTWIEDARFILSTLRESEPQSE